MHSTGVGPADGTAISGLSGLSDLLGEVDIHHPSEKEVIWGGDYGLHMDLGKSWVYTLECYFGASHTGLGAGKPQVRRLFLSKSQRSSNMYDVLFLEGQ